MVLKRLAIAYLFLLPTLGIADMVTVGLGGLTSHPMQFNRGMNFCNQLGRSGVIGNRSLYLRYGKGTWNTTMMLGEDSICSNVLGGFLGKQLWNGKKGDWVAGLLAGFYSFRRDDWVKWYRETPEDRKAPYPFHIKLGNHGLIPVFGFEYNFKLYEGKKGSLWLNNLLSLPITNHSLAYVVNF